VTCVYQLTPSGLPPCLLFTHKTYKNLSKFLNGNDAGKDKDELLSNEINCISYSKKFNSISINQDQCITCGSCAFSCPGGLINFTDELKADSSCSEYKERSKNELISIQNQLINFSGNNLDSLNSRFKSFEKYTGIKETTNISVWSGNVAKYIFGDNARVGLEIPLTIGGRDRNGRLDVCVLSSGALIVMEAKIGLKKLMAEGRYEAQILAYEEELSGLKLKEDYSVDPIKLLLVGDDEKDMLPQDHDLCSSKVGNLSNLFYKSILTHRIQFISARGLLAFAMSKLISPKKKVDRIFIETFRDLNTVGVLSNTVIKRDGDRVYLEPLNL